MHGDKTTERTNYELQSFTLELSKEEMKVLDLEGLFEKFGKLARDLADAQEKMLFKTVNQVVEKTGNTVSAGGDFQPKHFFEMLSKVHMEFDPETGKPRGQSFVMHPDTAAKIVPRMEAWGRDPAFVAEHERILAKKKEEWLAREDSRKLVD